MTHFDEIKLCVLGNVVARHDYLPYGEELIGGTAGRTDPAFGKSATVTQMFTGQERDGGTAMLDYFNARHFSAYVGGFMQVDPGNAGANIMSPQSWNGYGYGLGNPLGLTDPSGMNLWDTIKGWFGCSSDFCGGTAEIGTVDTTSFGVTGFLFFPTVTSSSGSGGPVGGHASKFTSLSFPAKNGSSSANARTCFAQLKSRPVNDPRAQKALAVHTFWWVQGTNGQRIISGGPSGASGATQHLNVWVNPNLFQGPDTPNAHLVFSAGPSSSVCGQVDSMISSGNWCQRLRS